MNSYASPARANKNVRNNQSPFKDGKLNSKSIPEVENQGYQKKFSSISAIGPANQNNFIERGLNNNINFISSNEHNINFYPDPSNANLTKNLARSYTQNTQTNNANSNSRLNNSPILLKMNSNPLLGKGNNNSSKSLFSKITSVTSEQPLTVNRQVVNSPSEENKKQCYYEESLANKIQEPKVEESNYKEKDSLGKKIKEI